MSRHAIARNLRAPRHSIAHNRRVWDRLYPWDRDGDEWIDMAEACGQPYEAWKASILRTFIEPNATPGATVLELAPGHGRWSREIAPRCGRLILVDLSPGCIDHCHELLRGHDHVEFIVNDGRSLPGVADGSVDFFWCFDSMVHMRRRVIAAYLGEIGRVLRPGGLAVLHHPGRRHLFLGLRRLGRAGPRGERLYNWLTLGRYDRNRGWRSDVSRRQVCRAARRHGLTVEAQIDRWGDRGQFTVDLHRDAITILRKPD